MRAGVVISTGHIESECTSRRMEWQGTSMDDCITSAEHSMSFNAIEQEQQEGRQQCSNQM